jgi:hypothetical protein
MDPYGSHIIATSRSEDFAREATAERTARVVRKRNRRTEPRSGPAAREVVRPAIA